MNNSLLRLQFRIQQAGQRFRQDERAQAMVEYVGIVFIVAALIGMVVFAASAQGQQIGSLIMARIAEAIEGIGK